MIFIQFDLEAVRYCPSLNAKGLFYKRRLAVYNLTVYDVKTRKAVCYMWHEGIAGRGSDEVGSCLFHYLREHANGLPFVLMSDTCGGQNRNVNIAAILMHAVQLFDIPHIDQVYFEPGHSMMEVDSVHAHIESTTKKMRIYSPFAWYGAVGLASKTGKYEVIEMGNASFYNVKQLRSELIINRSKDVDGNQVKWMKCCWFKYDKNVLNYIYFKYNTGDDFRRFAINHTKYGKAIETESYSLQVLQTGNRPISKDKYKDLMALCNSGIIPLEYHTFYKSLNNE